MSLWDDIFSGISNYGQSQTGYEPPSDELGQDLLAKLNAGPQLPPNGTPTQATPLLANFGYSSSDLYPSTPEVMSPGPAMLPAASPPVSPSTFGSFSPSILSQPAGGTRLDELDDLLPQAQKRWEEATALKENKPEKSWGQVIFGGLLENVLPIAIGEAMISKPKMLEAETPEAYRQRVAQYRAQGITELPKPMMGEDPSNYLARANTRIKGLTDLRTGFVNEQQASAKAKEEARKNIATVGEKAAAAEYEELLTERKTLNTQKRQTSVAIRSVQDAVAQGVISPEEGEERTRKLALGIQDISPSAAALQNRYNQDIASSRYFGDNGLVDIPGAENMRVSGEQHNKLAAAQGASNRLEVAASRLIGVIEQDPNILNKPLGQLQAEGRQDIGEIVAILKDAKNLGASLTNTELSIVMSQIPANVLDNPAATLGQMIQGTDPRAFLQRLIKNTRDAVDADFKTIGKVRPTAGIGTAYAPASAASTASQTSAAGATQAEIEAAKARLRARRQATPSGTPLG